MEMVNAENGKFAEMVTENMKLLSGAVEELKKIVEEQGGMIEGLKWRFKQS